MSKPGTGADRLVVAAVGLERVRQLMLMLAMIEVPRGARILELHTDPDLGYSALLLGWASRGGAVFSVDDTPQVADRARRARKLLPDPVRVSFHTGPEAAGWIAGAPYDVIVSNMLFGWLPRAWLDQCAPGATIVTPLEHDDARCRLFLRLTVDKQHRPTDPGVLIERDPHPHHARYDVASAVDLHLEADGLYRVVPYLPADQDG